MTGSTLNEFPDWHPAALGEEEDTPGTSYSASTYRTGTPYTGQKNQSLASSPQTGADQNLSPGPRTKQPRTEQPRTKPYNQNYKKGFRKPKPNPDSPYAPAFGAAVPDEKPKKNGGSQANPKNTLMFSQGSRLAEEAPSDDFERALVQGLGKRPEEGRPRSRAAKEVESEFTRAKNIVLNQLAASAKSRAQLEKKLADKEISPGTAAEVLDRFEAAKLVNDQEFAQIYVRQRSNFKKLSKTAIRRELAQKGVSGEIAEEALEQRTEEDERADAHELVRKKLRPSMDLSDRTQREKIMRRLVAMLARKGYSSSLAFSVVKEEIDQYLQDY